MNACRVSPCMKTIRRRKASQATHRRLRLFFSPLDFVFCFPFVFNIGRTSLRPAKLHNIVVHSI